MKTQIGGSKALTILLASAFLVALILSINFYTNNQTLKGQSEKERLNAENLLSEKLALQKDVDKFNNQLTTLKGKNKELDKSLADANQNISAKQTELNRLIKENKDVKEIKAKLAELEALKSDLNAQLNDRNRQIESINQEKLALNNSIDQLKNENKLMSENMQIMVANNFLIEALKGKKEKLTVVAKRTSKIKADFDIPTDIEANLNFKIIKPNGSSVDSKSDKTISLNSISNSTSDLVASSGSYVGIPVKTKRVRMVYQPTEKMSTGIYSIEVYNNGTYLGTSQVKLK